MCSREAWTYFEFLHQLRRRSLEFRERHVADVAKVFPDRGYRIESAHGQIAETREECGRLREFRLGIRLEANIVANRVLLALADLREVLFKAQQRFGIHPRQPFDHDGKIFPLPGIRRTHPFVDEITDSEALGAG